MSQLPDDILMRLKAVTRDLVRACGGVARAGQLARVSTTQVGRWQSPTDPDIVPLHHALVLERECGLPLVTAAMAEAHGRRLTDEVSAAPGSACVFRRHAELMGETAELMAETARVAADGACSPAEAAILDRAAADVEAATRLLRRDLAATRAAVAPGAVA